MENIMMYYHRQVFGFTKEKIASALGITPEAYIKLEKGCPVLTKEQADILGDLYSTPPGFFKMAANQLSALYECLEVITIFQNADRDLFKLEKNRLELDIEVMNTEKAKIDALTIKMAKLEVYLPGDEQINISLTEQASN